MACNSVSKPLTSFLHGGEKLRLSRPSNLPKATLQGSGSSRICTWDFYGKAHSLNHDTVSLPNDLSFKNWDPNVEAVTSQRFVSEKPRD